jgi:fatty acid-binding protein DegV
LGIKIIGRASDEGKLEPFAKVRSKSKVLKTFMTEMEDNGYNGGKVVIAHACNLDDAKTIEKMIKDKYENADIEIVKAKGLVSYYAEEKGILIGYEH